MLEKQAARWRIEAEPFGRQQVLEWAMCQPGVLMLTRLNRRAEPALAWEASSQELPPRPVETEADFLDDDMVC